VLSSYRGLTGPDASAEDSLAQEEAPLAGGWGVGSERILRDQRSNVYDRAN
jgi:hypothetical protein